MKKLVLLGLSLLSVASAQATKFSTYRSTTFYTSDGTFTTSTPLYVPEHSEFEKWKQVTKPYYDYMAKVAEANGYRRICEDTTNKAFLNGRTESEFRASEKALVKDFATPTSKYRAPKLLKSIPAKKITDDLSASFYFYKPTKADLKGVNIYGYFFSRSLGQGVVIGCYTMPKVL